MRDKQKYSSQSSESEDVDKGVFVNLTYDTGFKLIFADKANKPLLIKLLNSVLPPEARVDDIDEYLDREQQRDSPKGKLTQFDLVCKATDGTRFIVEFQRCNEKSFFQRCIYYSAGTYHSQLQKGDNYSKLKPVYSIGFLNYKLDHSDEGLWDRDHLISEYIFTEKRTGEIAPSTISVIFVELARFDKTREQCRSELDWLCYIFRHSVSLTEIPEEIRSEPFFDDLLEACRIAAFNKEKKLLYERSIMKEMDIIAQREYAVEVGFNKGYDKGMAEGKAEGARESAIKLLKAGVAPEIVAQCVGLNIDEVLSLNQN